MRRATKLLVAGLVVAASLALMLWNAAAESAPPALTVSDAKYRASSLEGQEIVVRGTVREGSVNVTNGRVMDFIVGDHLEEMPVLFNATPPDNFGAKEVVVRGTLIPHDQGWVLQAHSIQVGCASKY